MNKFDKDKHNEYILFTKEELQALLRCAHCSDDFLDAWLYGQKQFYFKDNDNSTRLELPFNLEQIFYYYDAAEETIVAKNVASVSVRLSVSAKQEPKYEIAFTDGSVGIWGKNVFTTKRNAAECMLHLPKK